MKRHCSVRGFSLVELVLTLSIMGVLSALSVSYFRGMMPRYHFQGAVRTLASDLSLARLSSISKNFEYKLALNQAQDLYMVYEGNLPENSTAWTFKYVVRLGADTDLYDVDFITGDNAIFRPDGTLDRHLETSPDLVAVVYLQGAGLQSRIRINPGTGRVTVERMVDGDWKDERYLKG